MFDIRFQVMLREVNREKRVSILTLNPYDTVFKLKTYLSNVCIYYHQCLIYRTMAILFLNSYYFVIISNY